MLELLRGLDANAWIAVGTIVIALATAAAAFGARSSAVATKRAVEAQLFSQLMSEYSSPAMAEAILVLKTNERAWRTDSGGQTFEQLIARWADRIGRGLPSDDPINNARRRVAHFFWKAARLIEEGLLTGGLREAIQDLNAKDIVYDVVIPLEEALARVQFADVAAAAEFARFRRAFPRPNRALVRAMPRNPRLLRTLQRSLGLCGWQCTRYPRADDAPAAGSPTGSAASHTL